MQIIEDLLENVKMLLLIYQQIKFLQYKFSFIIRSISYHYFIRLDFIRYAGMYK